MKSDIRKSDRHLSSSTSSSHSSTGLSSLFRSSDCFQSRSSHTATRSDQRLYRDSHRLEEALHINSIRESSASGANIHTANDISFGSRKDDNNGKKRRNVSEDTCKRIDSKVSNVINNNGKRNSMNNKSMIILDDVNESDNKNAKNISTDDLPFNSGTILHLHRPYTRQVLNELTSQYSTSKCNGHVKSNSKSMDMNDRSAGKMSFFASLSSSFSPCSSSLKKYTSSSSSINRSVTVDNCQPINSGKSVARVNCKKNIESLYHRRYSSHSQPLRSHRNLSSSTSLYDSPFNYSGSVKNRRNVYISSDKMNNTLNSSGKSSFANASYSEYRRNRSTKLHQVDSSSFYSSCYFYGNKLSTDSSSFLSTDGTYVEYDDKVANNARNALNVLQIKSNSKSPTRQESLLPLMLPKIEEGDDESEVSSAGGEDGEGDSIASHSDGSNDEETVVPAERESRESGKNDEQDGGDRSGRAALTDDEKKVILSESRCISESVPKNSENESTERESESRECIENSSPSECTVNCIEESKKGKPEEDTRIKKSEEEKEMPNDSEDTMSLCSLSLPYTSSELKVQCNESTNSDNNGTCDNDDDHSLIVDFENQNRNNSSRSKFEFRFIINLLIAHLTNSTGTASTVTSDVQSPAGTRKEEAASASAKEAAEAAVTLCRDHHHHHSPKMNLKSISSSSHDEDKNNHLSYRLTFHLRPMVSLFRRKK